MVEALLVLTIGLGVLCLRRLGGLLRREEESHAYLESRLEDQIRTGLKESARSVREETRASVTSLCDSLLAQLAQDRLAFQQKLEAVATQVVEASRIGAEKVDTLSKQVSRSSLSSGEKLDALALRIVEASRSSWEAPDASGRRIGEEAQRTRQEVLEALTSLQQSVDGALGEMKALHEQAVRQLRRPIRQAVAIQKEIRRGRDQQAWPAFEALLAASPVSEAVFVEDALNPTLGPKGPGEGPALADASTLGGVARRLETPDAEERDPLEREPGSAQTPSASPRPGRFVELLSRVRRRTLRPGSTGTDTGAGH